MEMEILSQAFISYVKSGIKFRIQRRFAVIVKIEIARKVICDAETTKTIVHNFLSIVKSQK